MLKGRTPLLIAAALGVFAFIVAWSALRKKETDVRKGWNLVPVVVASVDVPEDTPLTGEMIAQRAVPRQFVTSSVVKPDSATYLLNQRVLVPLQQGDLLLWSQFETLKSAERLSVSVAKDKRLMNVPLHPDEGVGGFVRPLDHVDVIAVMKDPKTNELYATTVVENVVVAATGRITQRTNVNLLPESERSYRDVTLVLTSKEAERLALLKSVATLSLTIRNEADSSVVPSAQKTTFDELEKPNPYPGPGPSAAKPEPVKRR